MNIPVGNNKTNLSKARPKFLSSNVLRRSRLQCSLGLGTSHKKPWFASQVIKMKDSSMFKRIHPYQRSTANVAIPEHQFQLVFACEGGLDNTSQLRPHFPPQNYHQKPQKSNPKKSTFFQIFGPSFGTGIWFHFLGPKFSLTLDSFKKCDGPIFGTGFRSQKVDRGFWSKSLTFSGIAAADFVAHFGTDFWVSKERLTDCFTL